MKILIKQLFLIKSLLLKKGFKHFIGHKDANKIDLYNETRYMSIFTKDN